MFLSLDADSVVVDSHQFDGIFCISVQIIDKSCERFMKCL